MDRIARLQTQLSAAPAHADSASASPRSPAAQSDVYVSRRDVALDAVVYNTVLTPDALAFVTDLANTFAADIEQLHQRRSARRVAVEQQHAAPTFLRGTKAIRDNLDWEIDPIPQSLRDRRVDIGDVSPANREFLLRSMNSGAQGVQVDFDDGHCPTWKNTLLGHFNIMAASRGTLALPATGETLVDIPALLLVRPRAWNMDEMGSIKATVLIENIFAAFEMEEILFELRHHSSGLNCGMWDYTASIVVNFRHDKSRLLPDRQQCVSMKSEFLKHYMELLIRTCKRRNAPATTGMVPFVLDQLPPSLSKADAIEKAKSAKQFEALAGSDGALVYDLELVAPIQEVFSSVRQHAIANVESMDLHSPVNEPFYERTLLVLPQGYVTKHSVELNLRVALFYVLGWFHGHGTVVVHGCVEDSATAEISRAQLWQWIRHQVPLDTTSHNGRDEEATTHQNQHVNAKYVVFLTFGNGSMTILPCSAKDTNTATAFVPHSLIRDLLLDIARQEMQKNVHPLKNLVAGINLVFRVVTMRSPPAFMTTFLLEQEPLTKSLE